MSEQMFPIVHDPECSSAIKEIPWKMLSDSWARTNNHRGMTLEELEKTGGLTCVEALAALDGTDLLTALKRYVMPRESTIESVNRVLEDRIKQWEKKNDTHKE
jgi:hypothetical protein